MQTAVIMQRPFNGKIIRQNSKTGFLNLNDLMECYLRDNPESSKRIDQFMDLTQTKEFAETIRESLLEAKNQNTKESGDFVLPLTEPINVIYTKRGKHGGTWTHPYLFLDFAMWLNPKFKLWAMSIIEDKLIELRNEAGDRFKDMNKSLKLAGAVSPRDFARETTMINKIVFNGATKEQRDSANTEQLDLLSKLQKYNGHLIEQGTSYVLGEKECQNFVKFYKFIK
jgi:hypothetical protein